MTQSVLFRVKEAFIKNQAALEVCPCLLLYDSDFYFLKTEQAFKYLG